MFLFSEQGDKMGGFGRGLHRAHSEPHPSTGQRVRREDLQSQRAGESSALRQCEFHIRRFLSSCAGPTLVFF